MIIKFNLNISYVYFVKKIFLLLIIVGGLNFNSKLILQTMNINEKIGKKINQMRIQKRFSIEHLANIADIDRNYLSDIENGKRNVSLVVLEKIIIALELDFSVFFNDENFKR